MIKTNIISRTALFGASKLEKLAAVLQGKGFGSFSIGSEVSLALRALGREPRLAIDGGGNQGDYTAALHARAPNCEVVVFEPARVNVEHLQKRFAGASNITIEPHGLSDGQRSATLFTHEEGSGAASLSRRNLTHLGVEFDREETVSLVSLDDYWREKLGARPIDLLKLDIEGHELAAMRGAEAALKSTQVVQFEFGGCNIDSRTYFQDFFYLLTGLGFQLYRITPLGLDHLAQYKEAAEAFTTTNFLAVRG